MRGAGARAEPATADLGRAASPAAARARRTRERVLDCAERVFAERGYHASKMGEVAALAGVSLSTVYASFPSKRDLFEALHEMRGRAFLARLQPALRSGEPVLVCLRRAVEAFVAWLVLHRNYLRVDLREGRSWAIGDVEASRSFQSGIGLWTRLVERGIREGVFCDEDPRLLATTAFAIMQVQLACLLERGESTTPEEIADRITRQLERALCASPPRSRRATPNQRRRP